MASITLKKCQGCQKALEESKFIDEKGIKRKRCPGCLEKRQKKASEKQLCATCGKKAVFNFSGELRGVRCSQHKLPGMVNLYGPEEAEKRFYKNVEELGGQVVAEYKSSNVPVECVCENGHSCMTVPASIQQGRGMCRICAGLDPETAKKNFIKRIEELGGRVLGEYKGATKGVKCTCIRGHECTPIPHNVQQGYGMCKVCAENDQETAKKNFIKRIEELGGRVVGEYKRNNVPVQCICENGHECMTIPANVQQGRGMCRICAGLDPETAKKNFIKRIEELGGRVLGEYKGHATPVECICREGHKTKPIPSGIQQGRGMCKICVGHDSDTAKQNFIKRIEELGGQVVGNYVNSSTPVECLCENGHQTNPTPNHIQKGHGMCTKCPKSSQSAGEFMVSKACQEINIHLTHQARHPAIPTLRYDFSCVFEGKPCYIEFDGGQHFENRSYFGRSSEGFMKDRQRDLLKTHICRLFEVKLVRIDYKWTSKPMKVFIKDLRDALSCEQLLVAESPLYTDWIHDHPDQATIAKYVVLTLPQPPKKNDTGSVKADELKEQISALERLQISV